MIRLHFDAGAVTVEARANAVKDHRTAAPAGSQVTAPWTFLTA
jgi:hypothetical protein